jgi:hypothetical protein
MSTALLERGPFKDQQHPPALMDFDNPSTDWVACDPTSSDSIQNQNSAPYSRYFTPKAAAPFEYIPNGVPYTANYNTTYSSSLGDDPNCSRPYINGFGLSGSMEDMTMAESHPPSAYVIDVPNFPNGIDRLPSQGLQHSQLQQRSREYDHQYYISRGIKLEDHESDFGSPYGSPASTRCSTPFDDLPSPMVTRRDMKVDDGAIDKEQPYAQLIYRALMDAPGNTMILKEIYQWFKDNTDKAADKETKGWQNSIRHNLSMNGVSVFLLLSILATCLIFVGIRKS